MKYYRHLFLFNIENLFYFLPKCSITIEKTNIFGWQQVSRGEVALRWCGGDQTKIGTDK